MNLRFGIKTVLFLVAMIAVAIPMVLHWQFENRWSGQRQRITNWSKKPNSDGRKMGYVHSVQTRNGNHVHFVIANAPVQLEGDVVSYPDNDEIELDGSRFYIQPPGKWVPDIESAIRIWDTY